jgi:hypothetical protein
MMGLRGQLRIPWIAKPSYQIIWPATSGTSIDEGHSQTHFQLAAAKQTDLALLKSLRIRWVAFPREGSSLGQATFVLPTPHCVWDA